MEKLYTLEEVSDIVKVCIRTLRKYIKEGKLKAIKLGRQYVVKQEAIDDLIKSFENK